MKYTEEELEEIYERITSEILYGVEDVIKEFKSLNADSPKKPIKPILKNSSDINEVENYAELLKKYNQDLINYKKECEIWATKYDQIEDLIVKYIKEKSGLFNIPEKYQNHVFSLAYEYGHSSGYGSVYSYLVDLVRIFDVDGEL